MADPIDPPLRVALLSSRLRAEALGLAGVGVLAYDLTATLRFIDDTAFAALGLERRYGRPADAVGQPLWVLLERTLPVELSPEGLRARGGRVTELELPVERGEGGRRWIQVNARWLELPEGGLVLAVLRDVTPRHRAIDGLAKAQRLESLGTLAGGIAHDFNNHLMAILGHLSVARDVLDEPGQAGDFLDLAEASVHRARGLAGRLLTFSRGGEPVRRSCDLVPVLRAAAAMSVAGSSTRCDLRVPPGLGRVYGDPEQLQQVFQNLLLNAQQAMPGGGGVRVTAANTSRTPDGERGLPAGDYVRIRVADRGVGIDEEQRERLFEPYFTTKPAAAGLGLASVHSIVRRHGGWVGVRSRPGQGTTVEILLPATAAAPAPAAPDTVDGERSAAGPRGAFAPLRGRILVMDDEEDLRLVLSYMLSRLGLISDTVAHGAAAIEAYRTALTGPSPFDVVILDLTVPGGMGGREAARALLELDPQVRLVVSSGYSNDDLLANHDRYGFAAALPKPYTLDQLRAVLGGLLPGGRANGGRGAPEGGASA